MAMCNSGPSWANCYGRVPPCVVQIVVEIPITCSSALRYNKSVKRAILEGSTPDTAYNQSKGVAGSFHDFSDRRSNGRIMICGLTDSRSIRDTRTKRRVVRAARDWMEKINSKGAFRAGSIRHSERGVQGKGLLSKQVLRAEGS